MEIAFHLGAHVTDRDHLVRCLMRNRPALLAQGIAIPGPGQYRQQLRKLAFALRDQETNADTQDEILDSMIEEDEVRRVVFSSEAFLSLPKWVVSANRLYHAAEDRIGMLRHLFPEARVELFLAIRNPATFLPALCADKTSGGVEQVLKDTDPLALRWSQTLARITEAHPDLPLTVWCDEDTPLLWPEVLRAVSGHAPDSVMDGWLAWYWDLVTPTGHAAMRRWFDNNPPSDDIARRKMLAALLARFVKPEVVETEDLLPGWTEDTLEALTAVYEEDLDLIASIPGVRLLEP
ncbi:MAG: hypothetical protein H6899_01790 [Rhodobacter sp.]|nr:hypothetical protein [Rhodobacter sp.]